MSITVRNSVGHEVYFKEVTEVKVGRGTKVIELRQVLNDLAPADPIVDFHIDEFGDNVYILIGGERA